MEYVYKNILVATDFSTSGNNIINLAIELCKCYQATMHLIHVKESRYILADPPPEAIASVIANDIDQEARSRLYEVYEWVLREHNIPMQIHMPTGIPFDEICKSATEMPIDLIVIGTNGTSGSGDRFIGTTAYNVVKYSIKPVLLIPYNYLGVGFKNILFPLQPSQDIKAKYDLAKPFLHNRNSHIHIGIFNLVKAGINDDLNNNELGEIISEMESEDIYCTNEVYTCKNPEVKVLELSQSLQSDLIIINSALDYKFTQFCVRPYIKQVISGARIPILCFRNCVNITDEAKSEEMKMDEKFNKTLQAH